MWENFDEPFVLGPKHAAVFRDAASCLSDFVGWEEWQEESGDMGIAVFDNLSQSQKQVAILIVSKALLDPNVDPPTVTAALAATVDAIYCQVECLVEMECDRDDDEASEAGETSIRQMLLEAVAETNYWQEVNDGRGPDDEPITPLSPDSDALDRWNDLIESLRTNILEDYDFEMDGDIADMAPEQAVEIKKLMNINPDYFVAVVEDPGPEQLEQIRTEIRQLLY